MNEAENDPPALVRLSEGLGPNAQPVARKELSAALDTSGSVVLIDRNGDILFYAADGKMKVERLGQECEGCIAANLKLAEAMAQAWNAKLKRAADPTNSRPRCGLGA